MDAYTVKKILPRLLVAVIAVQLSYYAVGFIIDVFNILGNGVGNLILSATGDKQSFQLQFGLLGDTLGTGGVIFAVLNFPAILSALIPLVLVVILAVLAVLFTLIFRQILVVMLLVLSPIAFVAWILPNTEKFFKVWSDFLLKTLFMYPMIIMLLAIGKLANNIISTLLGGAGEGENALYSVVQIVVAIAPFVLIPFTFKFAGGAMAAISGGIQGLRKAASKPLTESSGKRLRERRLLDGQGGTKWSKYNPAARWANAPYASKRGARGQEMKAAAALNERMKELGSTLSFDQQNALALGAKGVRTKAAEHRTKGDEEQARKLEAAYHSVRGMEKNSVDRAAAIQLVADAGFADEDMARENHSLFGKTPFSQKLVEQAQGKTIQAGSKSAMAWGLSGDEKGRKLHEVLSKMSSEDILKMKDYKEFEPTMKDILDGKHEATAPGSRDALISKLYSSLNDHSEVSLGRRKNIVETLGRSGIDAGMLEWRGDRFENRTYDGKGKVT